MSCRRRRHCRRSFQKKKCYDANHLILTPAPPPPPRSASFDGTVRIWDPAAPSKARLVLASHSAMVYAVAFSPNGDFVATTSADRIVAIHSTVDGALVKSYMGSGAGYDLSWAPEGNRVAACFATGNIAVIDMKR